MLGILPTYPIGAYCPASAVSGQNSFIKGDDVQKVMQHACHLAYPDPNHYMRLHIHCIMAHSNCVTTAIALYSAGVLIPEIAHCLQWSMESVEHYLHDCFKALAPLTEKAIKGAYLS